MSARSILAAAFATVAMAATSAHATPIAQYLDLQIPYDPLVYNIATFGSEYEPKTYYYSLTVDESWNATTRFTTFLAEPIGATVNYALYTGTNADGPVLYSWEATDIPANNTTPFYDYMLSAGEYVLAISTDKGEYSFSTNISAVPLPGAFWLFASALVGFLGLRGRRQA